MNTSIARLTKVGNVANMVRQSAAMRRDVTISALYHTNIHGNIQWTETMNRDEMKLFDPKLLKFIGCSFKAETSKEKAGFRYNKNKAVDFNNSNDFAFEFKVTTWEEFYPKVLALWESLQVKADKVEPELEERQEKARKSMATLIGKWADAGLSYGEIEIMIDRARRGLDIIPKKAKKAE